jgi:hypothetical protein
MAAAGAEGIKWPFMCVFMEMAVDTGYVTDRGFFSLRPVSLRR